MCKRKWQRCPILVWGCTLRLSFGAVEKVLAFSNNIREDRRSAFANRLKNYQKAGFPAGVNTGRGRVANYSLGHLLQLSLALQLNQLGLNPDRSIAVIQSDMHRVAMAFSHAAGFGPPHGEFKYPVFLYFDPAALSDLMMDAREDRAVRSFDYAGLGLLKERFEEWGPGGISRLALVNVSALLWDVCSYTALQFEKMSAEEVYEQVKIWASPYIHNKPYYGESGHGDPEA